MPDNENNTPTEESTCIACGKTLRSAHICGPYEWACRQNELLESIESAIGEAVGMLDKIESHTYNA